jgi:hypothetical protein
MRKLFAIFALLALAGTAALAQETTSEITGVVTDDQGLALPGVTVEAVSPNLVGKAATISDGSGKYRLRALVSGTYKLTFMLQNFATTVQENVLLRTGQVLTLNMSLKQAALEETVTVTAASPLIDVKRSPSAGTSTTSSPWPPRSTTRPGWAASRWTAPRARRTCSSSTARTSPTCTTGTTR